MFGHESTFFILPDLSTFDGTIGLDLLTQANATICLGKKIINFSSGSEEIKFYKCQSVNFMKIDDAEVPLSIRTEFQKVIENRENVFADPNEMLPYNTNIVATIRTSSNEAVYSKLYPYPMGVTDFVNSEVKDL